MILPGFTAECSLSISLYTYRGSGKQSRANWPGDAILPASCVCETVCYCPPPPPPPPPPCVVDYECVNSCMETCKLGSYSVCKGACEEGCCITIRPPQ
jgi:hypothetical protein